MWVSQLFGHPGLWSHSSFVARHCPVGSLAGYRFVFHSGLTVFSVHLFCAFVLTHGIGHVWCLSTQTVRPFWCHMFVLSSVFMCVFVLFECGVCTCLTHARLLPATLFVYVLTFTLTLRRCSGSLLPSSTGVRPHASSTQVVHSVGGGNGMRIAARRSAELSSFCL